MRVEKLRGLPFLSILCLFLSACGTDESVKTPPEVPGDTTPPVILFFEPDSDEENVEVDRVIRLEFDELVDEEAFRNGDIELFVGKDVEEQRELMSPRPFSLIFTENDEPGEGTDPVTGNDINVPASVVEIVPPNGRFALDTSYTFKVFIPTAEYFNKTQEERDRDVEENEQTNPDDSLSDIDFREDNYNETSHYFTVESGAWRSARQVALAHQPEPGESVVELTGDVQEVSSASNGSGELVVVSRQSVDGVVQAFISKYLPNANRWTTVGSSAPSLVNAFQLSTITNTNVFGTKVAIAANGRIAVAWYQAVAPGQIDSVWVRIFDGARWMDPIRFGSLNANANSPDLAFDSSGNLFVVWRQDVDGFYRIYSAVYPARSALPDPVAGQQISGAETGHANMPSLTAGYSGAVRAYWTHAVDNGPRRLLSRPNIGGSWLSIERIDNSDAGSVGNYTAVMGVRNEGMVAWDQFDGQRSNLMSRRILGASLASPVELMERDSTNDAFHPAMAIDPEGKIILVWRELALSTGGQILRVSVYQKNAGWAPTAELAGLGESEIDQVKISFDREGNATAIWKRGQNGTSSVNVRRYLKMTGWSDPALITASIGGMRGSPVLAQMFEDGRVLAVWSQYDGSAYRMMTNRYVEQSLISEDD